MKVGLVISSSIKALRTNVSRSVLTMLGIVIGISSVIIILSVGASAQNLILDQVKRIGSNLVVIFPGEKEENGPPVSVLGIQVTSFKNKDLEAILDKARVSNVEAGTGYVRGQATMLYKSENTETSYLGVNSSYMSVEDSTLVSGRFFYEDEEKALARVTVLGSELKKNLFGDADPIGKKIKIKNEYFEVVGYFQERGPVAFQNPDQYAYIPLLTAQKIMLGIDHLTFARLKISDSVFLKSSIIQIRETMREVHNLNGTSPDDFSISTTDEALGALTTITNAVKFFLGAVAAVSLVVGGVGIMNIMFVAITERTQEIGLRKAIGAKNIDIVYQFLTEAILISFLGGLIGLGFGIGISYIISLIVNSLGYDWSFIITFEALILSIGFSMLIGFIFGIYPAYKAAKLNPMEALRYE